MVEKQKFQIESVFCSSNGVIQEVLLLINQISQRQKLEFVNFRSLLQKGSTFNKLVEEVGGSSPDLLLWRSFIDSAIQR